MSFSTLMLFPLERNHQTEGLGQHEHAGREAQPEHAPRFFHLRYGLDAGRFQGRRWDGASARVAEAKALRKAHKGRRIGPEWGHQHG